MHLLGSVSSHWQVLAISLNLVFPCISMYFLKTRLKGAIQWAGRQHKPGCFSAGKTLHALCNGMPLLVYSNRFKNRAVN